MYSGSNKGIQIANMHNVKKSLINYDIWIANQVSLTKCMPKNEKIKKFKF